MPTSSDARDLQIFDPLPSQKATALVERARMLQRFALTSSLPKLLRGKNVGLLLDPRSGGLPSLLLQAAEELGAHVATTPSSLWGQSPARDMQHTARMLGLLYDAVVCQGMAPDLVHRIGLAAGIPVLDDIASDRHPSAGLVDQLGAESPAADRRRFVVQALLLDGLV